jgi:hypothetical protein
MLAFAKVVRWLIAVIVNDPVTDAVPKTVFCDVDEMLRPPRLTVA